MLHHGKVERNRAQSGIEVAHRRGGIADGDRLDERGKVRRIFHKGRAQGGGLPDEHAGVPKEAARREVEARRLHVRLLDEATDVV